MGGYGSYLHGLSHPERYAAIGAFSAPSSNRRTGGKRPDLLKLAKVIAKEGKKFPKIYAACGTEDFLFADSKKFAMKLKELGADVTWEEVEGYKHEWRFWNLEVERFMDWLPRKDYYAKLGKRPV